MGNSLGMVLHKEIWPIWGYEGIVELVRTPGGGVVYSYGRH